MLPDFFVVGAGRSGTTALHEFLGQHPEIFMGPRKSPNHFVSDDPLPEWEGKAARRMAREWIADRERYEALFAAARPEQIAGDVSPPYLQSLRAPERIHEAAPAARIVAILRDPVERAYAHFLGRRRDGLERREDFAAVARRELDRGLPDQVAFGSYLGCGRYHHFLEPYHRLFGGRQVRVYLHEDLERDPEGLLSDLFAFLGVDPAAAIDTGARHNATGEIRNPLLRFAWTRSAGLRTELRPHLPPAVREAVDPARLGGLRRPALDPGLRAELVEVFRDDIGRLAALIERDLGPWLRTEATSGAASGG